jgi:hypothetical protein
MITYFLALVLLSRMDVPPSIVEPHKDRESCMIAARNYNKGHPLMADPQAQSLGAEFVCLRMERDMV